MGRRWLFLASILFLGMPVHSKAQQPSPSITLDEAIARARANEPQFAAAVAASKTAALDHSIARAALLPSVVYHNAYLYTQPNGARNQAGAVGTQASPRFIANNSVHEYTSQAVVSETLGLAQITAVSRASAAASIAQANLEIARRGLTSAVVSLFYGITSAQSKLEVEQRAADEASDFVKLTDQREAARESAHADVLKAQSTQQQRQRDLADAALAVERARLDLGVLLFPDPTSPYGIVSPDAKPLPSQAEIESAARNNNPGLRGAIESVRAANLDVRAARAAYLPDLALNYIYGIDSDHFAVKGLDGTRNLGYSAFVTVDIPIWNWFSTQNRVRQAQIARDAASVVLTSAQRTLIAQLQEFYNEAVFAEHQLASLKLSVDTARESLRLTRLRYTAGEATVLEVVDAQASLTAAGLGLADGNVRYQLSLANLQLLTGSI